ncbi:hypothetical protein LOK49_LG05G02569 [Camellia lanceoleosa]|uniref:Uncharacterized protein n=1 Tax=Camellia lanceoleosa TaxID=1840588 RepID=A0ACC0HQ89_9ERIC|nr:hypothetical protein LOK49_LG05G02569 [Camellia lanceoleosa]
MIHRSKESLFSCFNLLASFLSYFRRFWRQKIIVSISIVVVFVGEKETNS